MYALEEAFLALRPALEQRMDKAFVITLVTLAAPETFMYLFFTSVRVMFRYMFTRSGTTSVISWSHFYDFLESFLE